MMWSWWNCAVGDDDVVVVGLHGDIWVWELGGALQDGVLWSSLLICPPLFARLFGIAFAYPVSDPIEAHVYCLQSLLFHGACCDPFGAGIVSDDISGWLWVSKFAGHCLDGACGLATDEESTNLSIPGGGHDIVHYLTDDLDGPVHGRIVGAVAQEKKFLPLWIWLSVRRAN
jgi:hypothetical protein